MKNICDLYTKMFVKIKVHVDNNEFDQGCQFLYQNIGWYKKMEIGTYFYNMYMYNVYYSNLIIFLVV